MFFLNIQSNTWGYLAFHYSIQQLIVMRFHSQILLDRIQPYVLNILTLSSRTFLVYSKNNHQSAINNLFKPYTN